MALLILNNTAALSALCLQRSLAEGEKKYAQKFELKLTTPIKSVQLFYLFSKSNGKVGSSSNTESILAFFLYLLMVFSHAIDRKMRLASKHTVKLSAIFYHKYAFDKNNYCAWSAKSNLRGSCFGQKMADEVNNENCNKLDERKTVAEFCRLLEKSRLLFNSLRYNFLLLLCCCCICEHS